MAANCWTVLNESSRKYCAFVRGPMLLLLLGEADTEEVANSQRDKRLKCELAEQFALILGDTLEARVVAVRLLDLAQANHERTVTQAEVTALAKKLRGPASDLRALIGADDHAALWVLLPGNRDLFLNALDSLKNADSAVGRGRQWPGSRADLFVSYLATAWREVYGVEPTATKAFVRIVEATLVAHNLALARELEDWTARALERLKRSYLA